jgi:hypothetical protein
MQAPKITLFNGQDSDLKCLEQQAFVTGVDFRWNGEQMVAIPHQESFSTGMSMNLQPVVGPDRKDVQMHFQATLTSLDPQSAQPSSVVASVCPEGKENTAPLTQTIQTPKFTTMNVDRVLSIPQGKTALLWAGRRVREGKNYYTPPEVSWIPIINRLFTNVGYGRETECLLILVTPRVLVNEEKPETVSEKPVMPRADGDEESSEPETKQQPEPQSKSNQSSEKAAIWLQLATRLLELCGIELNQTSPSDPTERMEMLLKNSENYRQIQEEYKRFWFVDQPSHLTFDRIHDGVDK